MKRIPSYSLHKATGQARVRINGKTHYLGKYGTSESKARYDALIAGWLNGGDPIIRTDLTVGRLCIKYLNEHAVRYYVKGGQVTSEVSAIRCALRPLVDLYNTRRAGEFRPLMLKAVQERMVEQGLVRTSINTHIGRIKRMFKWAVANELVDVAVLDVLKSVQGLRRGRSTAKESDRVQPVDQTQIEAVQPHVSRQVWAMIQIQLLTAMRPGEVRLLRAVELDQSGPVWIYSPSEHKTEHHGRRRTICIGPKAQAFIQPFLSRPPETYLFSAAEARNEFDRDRAATNRAKRITQRRKSQSSLSTRHSERAGDLTLAHLSGRFLCSPLFATFNYSSLDLETL